MQDGLACLKRRLQTVSQVSLINNSVSGETAHGGRNRIEQALERSPGYRIVELAVTL